MGIIQTTGQLAENFYASGLETFPVFVLKGKNKTVLFDSGVSCTAPIHIKALKKLCAERPPEILFLTHAHWDHCGSAAALKKAFPSLKTAASGKAAEIISRPNAVNFIAKLNRDEFGTVVSMVGDLAAELGEPYFQPFTVDIILKEGDSVDLGDVTVQVMETPGHTKDHMSFYVPEKKILIAGEACGSMDSALGEVIPEFVSGYDQYLASLKRLSLIPAEIMCQSHRLFFAGRETISAYFKQGIKNTENFPPLVYRLMDEYAGDIDHVMKIIKKMQYDDMPSPKQPEKPYLINLRAQINHLMQRKEERKNSGLQE